MMNGNSIKMLAMKFRNRFGDFVWYSILIFLALRLCDVVNAFVGIWLVPKYVSQDDLGAVLPLLQLSSVFGLPLSILVMTFKKFLNQYQTAGDRGKLKSMLRFFLISSFVMAIIAIALASIIMPFFFERIRINKGSLGILIIATAILSAASPVFMDSLQSLKKFKAITIINLVTAPLRMLVMLVTMPIRALSGYMLGQSSAPAFQIASAWWSLRKELGSDVKSVPFWSEDKKKILKYMMNIFVYLGTATISSTIIMTVLRQRLPEVESAAYYMISRFAELGTYVGLTVSYVMFPYVAEKHAEGKEDTSIVWKAASATFLFGCICTIILLIFGEKIFSITSLWEAYKPYVNDMAILCLSMSLIATLGCFNSYEVAMNRFSFMFVNLPLSVFQVVIITCFTGYGFFRGILPDNIVDWMASCKIGTLRNMLLFMLLCNIVMTIGGIFVTYKNAKRKL